MLYLVKMIRLKRAMENYLEMNNQLKLSFKTLIQWISGKEHAKDMKYLDKFIETNGQRIDEIEEKKQDMEETDYNLLDRKIFFAFWLKTIKAVVLISSISYFFAAAFKIVLNFQAYSNEWDMYGPPQKNITYTGPTNCSSSSMF